MVNSADLELVCHICNGPIKLETDLATDESGQFPPRPLLHETN